MLVGIAAPEPFHDEPTQERSRCRAVLGRIGRELRFAGSDGEGATLGNFMTAREQLRMRGEEFAHFGRRPEMIMTAQAFLRMRLAQQSQGADALDNIVLPAVSRQFVMNGE